MQDQPKLNWKGAAAAAVVGSAIMYFDWVTLAFVGAYVSAARLASKHHNKPSDPAP